MASGGMVLSMVGSATLGQCLPSQSGSVVIGRGGVSTICMAWTRAKSPALKHMNGSLFSGDRSFRPLNTPASGSRLISAAFRGVGPRAEAGGSDDEPEKSIAPLVPESPTGQFLVSILRSHPHLFPAAADQQLERLAADRDASATAEQQSATGTDLTLYKRIKEVKADERRKAVEEVIYALIVQKFVEGGIVLVPKVPTLSDSDTRPVEISPSQEKELEGVHSGEALEMVREHLTVVLGGRGTSSFLDQHTIAHISKLRVGQVYAASIMYGYFLRRVDQRFQLEKKMKGLLGAGETVDTEPTLQTSDDDKPIESSSDDLAAEAAAAIASLAASEATKSQLNNTAGNITPNGFNPGTKPSKLRAYVMSFDPETLHSCATMRAKESLNVIEKHAEALFGKPEIQVGSDGTLKVVSDDTIRVSFSGLRRLMLEAVAFGSFLWDVETTVDTQYNLTRQ